jgi:hypothetical protein
MAQSLASHEMPVRRKPAAYGAERLFSALDGRDLLVRGQAWHLEVYGICEEAGRRWIQLAIDGPHHYMLTVALAARAGGRQAVKALTAWLEQPSEDHAILNVNVA